MIDIDIDIPPGVDLAAIFPTAIRASRVDKQTLRPHPCGVYFQAVAVDPLTNLAARPYDQVDHAMKVDFLHLNILSNYESKEQIRHMAMSEPDWSLLLLEDVVLQLFQLKNSWEIVKKIKPKSVIELADTIAIIRPDKRHLVDQYIADKTKVRPKLYRTGADDKSTFRRSHAIAYAHTVILQLNTISRTGGGVGGHQAVEL